MSDMSFKQAKELIERFELSEVSLSQTLKEINNATQNFELLLKEQEKIGRIVPKRDKKIEWMKIIVALHIGFIVGLLFSKYFI